MAKKLKRTEDSKKDEVKKEAKEGESTVSQLLSELQSQFGEGAVMRLGDVKAVGIEAIPTGSFSLDLALGVGGYPKGRLIEIYGPESSGKTTFALHAVAEVQKRGGLAAYIDAEHAMDPAYAQKIGVKVDEILISQPESGEQGLNIAESLVKSEKVSLIVVDSVAALAPKAEIEGEIGDQQIGLQARLMSQALRKLSGICAKTGTTIIFLNQTRMKIATMSFGNPETTPGGLALKFYASVRIQLTPIGKIKKGEEVVGSRIRAKVVKNKVSSPFKVAELDIMYNIGINRYTDILNLAMKFDVVTKSGITLSFEGVKLGVGLGSAAEFLAQNPTILEQITAKTTEKYNAAI